jgi:hypothetical protein
VISQAERRLLRFGGALACASLAAFLAPGSWAQETGPLPPPSSAVSPSTSTVSAAVHPPAPTSGRQQGDTGSSAISTEPPAIPVEQIIQKFAEREAEFKKERDNYTYTQTFIIQTLDVDGHPDGEYRMTSDILFTPQGKRYEKVVDAPQPTLTRIQLSQQDLDDLEHVQPFVLTTDELPKYDIKYVGRQQVDELHTYVFDVGPKKIEKNQRYFQGRIWVDDKDLEIVKTDGKAVPDIRKKGQENVFPRFETYRENIEGHYWFPTYTRSNDVLRFETGDVPIHMVVRYENYKRFGVTIKLGQATEVKPQN